jgi:hypothetical protein
MMETQQTIDWLVSLGKPTPKDVSAALGVPLLKGDTSPYWDAYEGGPAGAFLNVCLKIGRADGTWLLFLQYEPSRAPQRDALDLRPYGPVVDVEVNPRIPPEGTQSFKFEYRGVSVFFEFTAVTQRLRSISLEHERGEGATN